MEQSRKHAEVKSKLHKKPRAKIHRPHFRRVRRMWLNHRAGQNKTGATLGIDLTVVLPIMFHIWMATRTYLDEPPLVLIDNQDAHTHTHTTLHFLRQSAFASFQMKFFFSLGIITCDGLKTLSWQIGQLLQCKEKDEEKHQRKLQKRQELSRETVEWQL